MFLIISYKQTGRYAFRRLIFAVVSACGLQFLALRASTWPTASISACGLNFRCFGPELDRGFSAALWALQYALQRWWCVTMATTSIWRHSQSLRTALLWPKKRGCKSVERVKFSQTNDLSATSDLAYVPAMYNTDLRAKFCNRTSCRVEIIGGRNSQI